MKYICTFGASSPDIGQNFLDAAYLLGQLIAQKGWGCINGGGKTGIMRAVSDGALDRGGQVMGIIPKFMVDNGWNCDALSTLLLTTDMHERKSKMQELSSAVIALPGGIGTFEELMEVLTWRQLNIIVKPIVILNTDGYYNHLIDMMEHAIGQGFIPEIHRSIFHIAATPEEAISLVEHELATGSTPTPPKFHDRRN